MKHLLIQLSSFLHLLFFAKKRKAKKPRSVLRFQHLPNSQLLKFSEDFIKNINAATYPYPKPELESLRHTIEEMQRQMVELHDKDHRSKYVYMNLEKTRERLTCQLRLLYDGMGFFQPKKQPLTPPKHLPKLFSNKKEANSL